MHGAFPVVIHTDIEKEFAKVIRTLHELEQLYQDKKVDVFLAAAVCYLSSPEVTSQLFYRNEIDDPSHPFYKIICDQNEQIAHFLWWSLTNELMIRLIFQCSKLRVSGRRINLNLCKDYVHLLTLLLPPALLEQTRLELAQSRAIEMARQRT